MPLPFTTLTYPCRCPNFYHRKLFLAHLEFHINRIIMQTPLCLAFVTQHLWESSMLIVSMFFCLCVVFCCTMCHYIYIFLLTDIWIISNVSKSATNILVQVSWWTYALIFLGFLLDIHVVVEMKHLSHTEGISLPLVATDGWAVKLHMPAVHEKHL